MTSTLPAVASCSAVVAAMSRMVGAKPRLPASLAACLARPSAVPVWEPQRMVSGASSAAGAAALAAEGEPLRLNMPARKPLSQARCSAVKGAESGMKGAEDIQVRRLKLEVRSFGGGHRGHRARTQRSRRARWRVSGLEDWALCSLCRGSVDSVAKNLVTG